MYEKLDWQGGRQWGSRLLLRGVASAQYVASGDLGGSQSGGGESTYYLVHPPCCMAKSEKRDMGHTPEE